MQVAARRVARLGSLCDVSVASGPRFGLSPFEISKRLAKITKEHGRIMRFIQEPCLGASLSSPSRMLGTKASAEDIILKEIPEDTKNCSVSLSNNCHEASDMPFNKQPVASSFHDIMLPSRVEKVVHNKKISELLQKYTQVFVCLADNVASNQLQSIRRHLRPDSVVLMGKNTVMKRSMEKYAVKSENSSYQNMTPLLVGNVALIFTKGNLKEVCEKGALIAKFGTRPLSRGLIVKAIYGGGSVLDPVVLDLIEDDSVENVSACISLWQPFFWLSTVLQ